MKTITKIQLMALISIGLLVVSCSPTTQITKSWADSSVTNGSFQPFKKVLVIASLKDQASRRLAEDRLSKEFKSGAGVPSYSYLTDADTVESVVRARMNKDGFDGLLVIRLTNVSQSLNVQNYSYPTYYGWYRGYGYGYGGYGYSGGTSVTVDNTYFVETSVYGLPAFKLLWAGSTSTLNPSNLNKTLDEVISAARADMIAKGIIKQ